MRRYERNFTAIGQAIRSTFVRGLWVSSLVCAFSTVCFVDRTVQTAYADAPSVADFGQQVEHHLSFVDSKQTRALFVTEDTPGLCEMEEHRIHDDAVVGFAGVHPAWQLNVPLTWYFLEPVYEKDNSAARNHDGRLSI